MVSRLPAWCALPLAAVSGLALAASFPDSSVGWLSWLGILGILTSVAGRRFWWGFLLGLVAGLSFWVPLIEWLNLYLGPVPWLALAVTMAVFFATGTAVWTWISFWLLARQIRAARWALPLIAAAVWVARETITGVWPYGGFPWGRVALAQSSTSFAEGASWLGLSGLSFAVVWICAVPVVLVWTAASRTQRQRDEEDHPGIPCRPLLAGVATVIVLAAVPAWGSLVQSGTIRVAAIQGNANAGLFAEHSTGEWLENHIAATESADLSGVDLVIWPENSSDIDPEQDSAAAAQISALVDDIGVPLVFGTIQERDGEYFNTSLLWVPGEGIAQRYDKRHPVPFAEYMPNREFFHALAPDLVDMVQRDYSAGTSNGVFEAASASFGVDICFDVAYDDVMRDAVFGGAQFLVSQTNNADFGWSDESAQQLAIGRMQAIASGRSLVSISTVGYSAIFGPDGSVLASAQRYTSASLVADVPLVDAISPGTIMNVVFELAALVSVGGVGSVLGLFRLRQRITLARREHVQ